MIFIHMKYGTQTAGYFGVKRIRKPPVVKQVIEVNPRRIREMRRWPYKRKVFVERYADGDWKSFRITGIKDMGHGEVMYLGEHW